jgi:hypothetical protein
VQPSQPRFKIRCLMEATIIAGIGLWSLRFSLEAWSSIVILLILYVYGLAPMRSLYGFSPLRSYFARFSTGYMGDGPGIFSRRDGKRWTG